MTTTAPLCALCDPSPPPDDLYNSHWFAGRHRLPLAMLRARRAPYVPLRYADPPPVVTFADIYGEMDDCGCPYVILDGVELGETPFMRFRDYSDSLVQTAAAGAVGPGKRRALEFEEWLEVDRQRMREVERDRRESRRIAAEAVALRQMASRRAYQRWLSRNSRSRRRMRKRADEKIGEECMSGKPVVKARKLRKRVTFDEWLAAREREDAKLRKRGREEALLIETQKQRLEEVKVREARVRDKRFKQWKQQHDSAIRKAHREQEAREREDREAQREEQARQRERQVAADRSFREWLEKNS